MDRRTACLEQANLCRDRARKDDDQKCHWLSEAEKWEQRAVQGSGKAAVTFEVKEGCLAPKEQERSDDPGGIPGSPSDRGDGKIP